MRGGDQNVCIGQWGYQNFWAHAEGGPEKIGNPQSQTDAPLPVNNDSSLMIDVVFLYITA